MKKTIATGCLLLLICGQLFSENDLFKVDYSGLAGFIDKTGEIKIWFQYDSAGAFSNGLAAIVVTPYYLKNIHTQYDNEELVQWGFKTEDGNWKDDASGVGYIDKEGHIVIPPKFNSGGLFSSGVAIVKTMDYTRAVIDTNGKILFEEKNEYTIVSSFVADRAIIRKENEDGKLKEGFINPKGEITVECTYNNVLPFSDGLAPVTNGDRSSPDSKYGFVDKNGKLVIDMNYYIPHDIVPASGGVGYPVEGYGFSEGLSAVGILEEGKRRATYYFIDNNENKVLGPYKYAESFSEGKAYVRTLDDERQFINTKGEVLFSISDDYDIQGKFKENRLRISREKDPDAYRPAHVYGFLNENGDIAVECTYDEAEHYRDGLAKVDTGYIDMDGNLIWSH